MGYCTNLSPVGVSARLSLGVILGYQACIESDLLRRGCRIIETCRVDTPGPNELG